MIKKKAKFIFNHFCNIMIEKSNEYFTPKGMIVVSRRSQIILYKKELEKLIRERLTEEEEFHIVVSFTDFIYNQRRIREKDFEVNGIYCKDFIKQFLDKNSKVKMIIVADKLQTGFDAPLLHSLFFFLSFSSSLIN